MSYLHHDDSENCGLCFAKLREAHPYLVSWFWRKKKQHPNMHVSWAYRNAEDQNEAFAEGKSKLKYPQSCHNKQPAQALDIFLIDNDGMARFPVKFYTLLNAENEAESLPLQWGGTFKSLGDYDHWQLDPAKFPTPQLA